jgi:protein tyrosine/serine phosphatase
MRKNKSKKQDLPNFHQINENLFRGGQPTAEGIKQLSELGIKTIVTFRDMREKIIREKQIAEENGLRFIHLHLSNWFAAEDSEIEKIIETITNPEHQPVFIHCKRGADRTGTVVAVYRMLFDGWTARQANREAKKFGIGWWQVWMKDYIKDYYKRMQDKTDEIG